MSLSAIARFRANPYGHPLGDKPQRLRGVVPDKAQHPLLSAARRPDDCKLQLTSRNATERIASQEGRPVFAIAKMPQRI